MQQHVTTSPHCSWRHLFHLHVPQNGPLLLGSVNSTASSAPRLKTMPRLKFKLCLFVSLIHISRASSTGCFHSLQKILQDTSCRQKFTAQNTVHLSLFLKWHTPVLKNLCQQQHYDLHVGLQYTAFDGQLKAKPVTNK